MGSSDPTIIALDTSALLAVVTTGPGRPIMIEALESHDVWCASELAFAEALPAIDRLTEEPVLRADLEDSLRYVWDWFHIVPIDPRCLDDAATIARQTPARMSDAIHIASARRLPGQPSFATLDAAQIGLAERFGLVPVSP